MMIVYFTGYTSDCDKPHPDAVIRKHYTTLTQRVKDYAAYQEFIKHWIKGTPVKEYRYIEDGSVFGYSREPLALAIIDDEEWALDTDAASDILNALKDSSHDCIAYYTNTIIPEFSYYSFENTQDW